MHKTFHLAVFATALTAMAMLDCSARKLGVGELGLYGSFSLNYDTNVTANSTSTSDGRAVLTVGTDYTITRKNYIAGAGVNFSLGRFFRETDRDYENFSFDIKLTPTQTVGGRTFNFKTDLGVSRESRSDGELGQFVTETDFRLGGTVTYIPNRKLTFSLTPSFRYSRPDNESLVDRQRYQLNFRSFYNHSRKLSFSVGTGYTRADSDGEITNDSYTLNAGLSGQLSPKISGNAFFGAQYRENQNTGEGELTPNVSVGLNWAANSLTGVGLNANHDFGTTAADDSTISSSISINVSRTFNRKLSGSWSNSLTRTEFESTVTDREDLAYNSSLNFNYTLPRNWRLGIRFGYEYRDSDSSTFEFDRFTSSARLSTSF